VARKREALERVLAGRSGNSEVLFGRLQGLVKSWSAAGPADEDIPLVDPEPSRAWASLPLARRRRADSASVRANCRAQLRDLFAYTLEGHWTQLASEPELAADARMLAHKVRTATSRFALEGLLAGIKRFAFRLEILAEDRAELRAGLLNLLQLLIENVGELVTEDRWLAGTDRHRPRHRCRPFEHPFHRAMPRAGSRK
jgi:diguanylate cyclase